MSEDLSYTTPSILEARNPLGFFKPFDEKMAIFTAHVDRTIPVEKISPSQNLFIPFVEHDKKPLDYGTIKGEMIANRLGWKGEVLGLITYSVFQNEPTA